MIRFLIASVAVAILAVNADARPKCGSRLFKGHIRTGVHNIVDAPFRIVESKPLRTTFGFVAPAPSGCANGKCPLKK